MHGNIAMQLGRNRKGRKRKSGYRKPSGDVILIRTDYRAMAALTPTRISLPAAYRLDERAETQIGRLNIVWRTSGLPYATRPGIPDVEYEAGTKYANVVRAYLRLANAPRLAQMQNLWPSGSDPEALPAQRRSVELDPDGEKVTERYTRAYEAVSDSAGRPGHMAVNRAVVHDQPCSADQLIHLRVALRGLAAYFGLTNQRN
jgi:hypothetical protein